MLKVSEGTEQGSGDLVSQEFALFNNELQLFSVYIDRVEDMSCSLLRRVRIHFKNGLSLSVVRGIGTYGNEAGLFEIAPFSAAGKFDGALFDDEDKGEHVLGWCDVAKVNHYITKLGTS